MVDTLAGRGGIPGFSDARGAFAKFSGVTTLALDTRTEETLFVIDASATSQRVRAVDTRTGQVRTIAGGPASAAPSSVDGVGSAARFQFGEMSSYRNQYTIFETTSGVYSPPVGTPVLLSTMGAAYDPSTGSLLVSDTLANRIRRVSVPLPTPPPSPPLPPSPPPSPPSPPAQAGSAVVSTAADLVVAFKDPTVTRFVLVRSVGLQGGGRRLSQSASATDTALQIDRPGEDITVEGTVCSISAAAGAAAACAVVDGGGTSRIVNATVRSLTIRNLVLSAGYSGAAGGGCIFAPGALVVLDNAMLSGCSTTGVRATSFSPPTTHRLCLIFL